MAFTVNPATGKETINPGNNEWYTPVEYITAARQAMGGIDLDPASCDHANLTVQAKTYYTLDTPGPDHGLSQPWAGRVWMNPPYASGLIEQFCTMLVRYVKSGQVTQACVIVNNSTETEWFSTLASAASAATFLKTRVKFYARDGKKAAPLTGQVVVYFGSAPLKFRKAFGGFGWTVFVQNMPEPGLW
jgi:hypothetical protein